MLVSKENVISSYAEAYAAMQGMHILAMGNK